MKSNPKILYIRVSENCNSHCFMCHYAGKNDSYVLSDEQYDKLLDYATNQKIKVIRFTGGEPLLHKNIINYIKKANDLGFKTSIITNGFLLKFYAKKLVDAGLSQCIISLDGSCSEVHDSLRNFKGCFNNILGGIHELKKYNDSILIRINTVVSGKNIKDIINIYNLLLELSVNQWSIIPVKYKENTWIEDSIIYYNNFLDVTKNNDSGKLEFLGDSRIFAGLTKEDIVNTFSNNIRLKSKNSCRVIDYVRFYIPDKDLLVPCNCISHRLNQISISQTGDMEKDCEQIKQWLSENCKNCTGCEPLNVYINDHPEVMEDLNIIRY